MPEQVRDLTKLFKVHVPTLDQPLPKMGAGLMGGTDEIYQKVSVRIPEFIPPLKLVFVGAATTFGEVIGHHFIGKEPKLEEPYYGKEFLWSLPALVLGSVVSEFFLPGAPPVFKAAALGTIANGVMAIAKAEFEMVPFLIREALLVPLSLLIVEKNGSTTQGAP